MNGNLPEVVDLLEKQRTLQARVIDRECREKARESRTCEDRGRCHPEFARQTRGAVTQRIDPGPKCLGHRPGMWQESFSGFRQEQRPG